MNELIATIWRPGGDDLWFCAPELALVGTITAVLLVSLPVRRSGRVAAVVSLAGLLVVLLLTRAAAPQVVDGGRAGLAPAGATPLLLADNFTVFFRTLITLFLGAIIFLWLIGRSTAPTDLRPEVRPAPAGPEFFVLLLTSALGMMLMVSTTNLLVMLIAIETTSLPSYAIVAADKRSRTGAEAALKYVLFGAASASFMVFGITLIYGSFGTLDLAAGMASVASGVAVMGPAAWLGLAATGAGIAFKIAAVPFHFWCPDVFEGAPIEITTWLSVASKAAALGLLLRLVGTMAVVTAGIMEPLAWGIGILAAITCTIGNLAALRQDSVKRMLAYSSIAHAGYMMMAAAIVAPRDAASGNPAVAALAAYVIIYAVMNLGAFAITAMVTWRTGSDQLSAFVGLGRRSPWLALPMAVCLFSLVGLPPLGGFAAKWWLLVALSTAASAQTWLWGLVVVAVINTAISLYYYVRVIRCMYLADDARQPAFAPHLGGALLVNACAIGLVLTGTVLFSPLSDYAHRCSSHLFDALRQPVAQRTAYPPALSMADTARR